MRQPTEGTRDPDALLDAILARTEPLPLPEAARQALVSLLADAPFASRRTGVPTRLRGLLVDGMPLRATESSLRAHLAKRMFDSAQWTTTTTAEYLADLRATIQHPDAVLHVYLLEGEAHIGVVGPTVVPPTRRGRRSGPLTVVIYRRLTGTIETGYQVSSAMATGIPPTAVQIP